MMDYFGYDLETTIAHAVRGIPTPISSINERKRLILGPSWSHMSDEQRRNLVERYTGELKRKLNNEIRILEEVMDRIENAVKVTLGQALISAAAIYGSLQGIGPAIRSIKIGLRLLRRQLQSPKKGDLKRLGIMGGSLFIEVQSFFNNFRTVFNYLKLTWLRVRASNATGQMRNISRELEGWSHKMP